jgi:hypothetical protein
MDLPNELIVEEGAYASDGGSIYLRVRDAEGAQHHITLWQHMFTEVRDPKRLPGRLYFDKSLIAVRSESEQRLIQALRAAPVDKPPTKGAPAKEPSPGMTVGQDLQDYQAKIAEGPAAALAHLVKNLLDYVESTDYVELAKSLDAKDGNR